MKVYNYPEARENANLLSDCMLEKKMSFWYR